MVQYKLLYNKQKQAVAGTHRQTIVYNGHSNYAITYLLLKNIELFVLVVTKTAMVVGSFTFRILGQWLYGDYFHYSPLMDKVLPRVQLLNTLRLEKLDDA